MSDRDERWSTRPLVPGTIIGVRSFKLRPPGDVISPVMTRFVWQPGENVSTCHIHEKNLATAEFNRAMTRMTYTMTQATAHIGGQLGRAFRQLAQAQASNPNTEATAPEQITPDPTPFTLADLQALSTPDRPWLDTSGPPHTLSGMDCHCGFYAYHQGSIGTGAKPSRYPSHGPMMGIVEGYGTVVVGNLGFRAEKMRILCFIEDRDREIREMSYGHYWARDGRHSWRKYMTERYDEIPLLPWLEASRRFPPSPRPDPT